MYYNRVIRENFAKNIMEDGKLRWLFDYVKGHADLDFLIGKNNQEEWISVYRGLTRIITIHPTSAIGYVRVDAAQRYKEMAPDFFGRKLVSEITEVPIEVIKRSLEHKGKADHNYNNKKEGFYQNEFSRKFGICGSKESDFVILDKEVVVGYNNEREKTDKFSPIQSEYKELQRKVSECNPKRYGQNLGKKSIGNELDFLAVNKEGDVLLIEYKHGTNTSGIYLSPLQIGMYFQIFNSYPQDDLQRALIDMFTQKQEIGLISTNWNKPVFSGKIIPVLIISNPNYRSSSYDKFLEVLEFCRKEKGTEFLKDLRTYAYKDSGLSSWGVKP